MVGTNGMEVSRATIACWYFSKSSSKPFLPKGKTSGTGIYVCTYVGVLIFVLGVVTRSAGYSGIKTSHFSEWLQIH